MKFIYASSVPYIFSPKVILHHIFQSYEVRYGIFHCGIVQVLKVLHYVLLPTLCFQMRDAQCVLVLQGKKEKTVKEKSMLMHLDSVLLKLKAGPTLSQFHAYSSGQN